jgi:MFS family permease
MFAYGFLSVVLMLYLRAQGLQAPQIGVLITFTLLGDVALSLWMTTSADRWGRKRMLMLGALLMMLVGFVFAATGNYWWLLAVATIGVLSPSDKEVGPFLSIEQAALSQEIADADRTNVFAWYNLVGSLAAAFGALASGFVCSHMKAAGHSGAEVYRPVILAYGVAGVALCIAFLFLSPRAEASSTEKVSGSKSWFGLHRSQRVVLQLSALFSLDAFGGGFIVQSVLAYWFHVRYQVEPALLGTLFFVANLFAAASALAAASLAKRYGLINTMVFTHLPSNLLLILVPLMPNLPLAIGLLLLRFTISQMDVPTRQSYTMAVVHPDERSAASGITTVARSIGAALAPSLAGYLMAQPGWIDSPLYIAGGIKIVYDLWLYRLFITRREQV